jgi:hypothetical protein
MLRPIHVLDHHRGDADPFVALDGPVHVQRVPAAVVRVADDRNVDDSRHPARKLDELGHGERPEIAGSVHARRDRLAAREDRGKPEILGHLRGESVEDDRALEEVRSLQELSETLSGGPR